MLQRMYQTVYLELSNVWIRLTRAEPYGLLENYDDLHRPENEPGCLTICSSLAHKEFTVLNTRGNQAGPAQILTKSKSVQIMGRPGYPSPPTFFFFSTPLKFIDG